MIRLFRAPLALMILVLAGCATAPASSSQGADADIRVEVARAGDRFTADYVLDRDAPVWAFVRSSLIMEVREPWRPRQWTVETPGVLLERRGNYDVLRAVDGGPVPRSVRLTLRPEAVDLEADYATLMFSDGAVAMPTHIFDVFPVSSLEAVEALPRDLNGVSLATGPAEVRWTDPAGQILFRGERWDGITTNDADTYVLFGDARVTRGERLTTVLDPTLPSWVPQQIGEFAPWVADFYEARLGEGAFGQPTVMVSWNGPTERMTSMSGSVMPGLIVMSYEGQGIVTPDQEMIDRSRWFIAHESAHFWLGQTVRYAGPPQAWITEGGADLMAIRALAAADPTWDARAELQREVDDCVSLTDGRGVQGAGSRGEHRAYYACGAVLWLVAEAAQGRRDGGDGFDFLRPLIAANREDEVLSRQDWLAALMAVSGDVILLGDVERLLDDGSDDPAEMVAGLLARVGIAHRIEGERVVLG
ncbi:hypothetical protein [Brevundimonas lutea]|uniref:hypothetical protein n=1 Tax=Brevundimonas lutea TaxID=2293980 RepID=UPI000F020CA8|nr:hypothetical protein [Brevundimonas lutea]